MIYIGAKQCVEGGEGAAQRRAQDVCEDVGAIAGVGLGPGSGQCFQVEPESGGEPSDDREAGHGWRYSLVRVLRTFPVLDHGDDIDGMTGLTRGKLLETQYLRGAKTDNSARSSRRNRVSPANTWDLSGGFRGLWRVPCVFRACRLADR